MKIRLLCLFASLMFIFSACTMPDSDGNPTPPGGPTAPGAPTAEGDPTAEGAPTVPGAPTAEGAATAPGAPTAPGEPTVEGAPTIPGAPTAPLNGTVPASSVNHCSLFDQIQFSMVLLEWQTGQPLTLYINMPGGVPGLEKPIEGDNGPWDYSMTIGQYQTQDCNIQPGYPERLYCSISLPSEYANTSQTLKLNINGCDVPIYQITKTNIASKDGIQPTVDAGGGGGGGSGNSCTLSCPASCEPDPSCSACQGIGGGSCKP